MTYRSEPEDDNPIYFDIAFMGYNSKLSEYGLKQFAENNKEQVLKFTRDSLYFKDGTRIRSITYDMNLRGYKFDQLILFDDNRWNIHCDKMDEIYRIIKETMYMSNVPEEYLILEYEDIRQSKISDFILHDVHDIKITNIETGEEFLSMDFAKVTMK